MSVLCRRRFLTTVAAVAPCVALPSLARARSAETRALSFRHLHTGERLEVAYFDTGDYVPDALRAVDHLLRDFRTDQIGHIDPALLDLLHALAAKTESRAPFQIISGYRSPATNRMLREIGGGGVATRSLHMQGQAIDIRLAGVPLDKLRDAARAAKLGGVGYYPKSDFVHVDTGRVRSW